MTLKYNLLKKVDEFNFIKIKNEKSKPQYGENIWSPIYDKRFVFRIVNNLKGQ